MTNSFVGFQANEVFERSARGEIVGKATDNAQRSLRIVDWRHQPRSRTGLARLLATGHQNTGIVRARLVEQLGGFIESALQSALENVAVSLGAR